LWLLVTGGCGGLAARSQNAEGVTLFNHSQYEMAMRKFEQAMDSDPNSPDGYYNLAATHHRLWENNHDPSHLSHAEHYYQLCWATDRNHRECHRGLAVLLAQQQRTEEAFDLLERWVQSNPTSPEPRIELARLSEEFGRPEAAEKELVKALSVDSQSARAWAALGSLREQQGEPSLALNNYRRSLWSNRFQPEVADRVAALQPAVNPTDSAVDAPIEPTRIVRRNDNLLR
jgi:tetratricopeptide (TPR) repeat protein